MDIKKFVLHRNLKRRTIKLKQQNKPFACLMFEINYLLMDCNEKAFQNL